MLQMVVDSITRPLWCIDLHTALITRSTLGQGWEQVGDVVPRMPVQAGAQSLLVQVMGNETDAATEHEQTVQDTHLEVVLGFFWGESTAVPQQVDKADSNTAVNVKDEVVLLGGGYGLDSNGIVKELVRGEVFYNKLLDELDTQIRVGARFDSVADTGNWADISSCKMYSSNLTYSACSPFS